MSVAVTDDERDVITELMNVGVGHAARALSQLVGDEVLLSVPEVQTVPAVEAQQKLGGDYEGPVAAVAQRFSGFVAGTALLIFPGERSLELVRVVLGPEVSAYEVSELEQETLAEIGNIILNNCLATMANMLHREISTELPEPLSGSSKDLLPQVLERDGDTPPALVLLVQIDFTLKARDLKGYLAFFVDMHATDAFHEALQSYLAELEAG